MTRKTPVKKTAAKSTGSSKSGARGTAKKTSVKKSADRKTSAVASKKAVSKKAPAKKLSPRARMMQNIKQNLLNQREALLKEAEETLNNLPSDLNFPDMGDQASAEADRNFMLRLRDRERMLLKKIDETIERIDKKDYGICEECGNEIGIKRLEARPVTTYCIECKTRQEEKERIAEGG